MKLNATFLSILALSVTLSVSEVPTDCGDLANSTCVGCLNNTLQLKCKFVVTDSGSRSCKNLNASIVSNSTSVIDVKDCDGVPELFDVSEDTVLSGNGIKLGDDPHNETATTLPVPVSTTSAASTTPIAPPTSPTTPTPTTTTNTTVTPETTIPTTNTTVSPETTIPTTTTTTTPATTTTASTTTTSTVRPSTTTTETTTVAPVTNATTLPPITTEIPTEPTSTAAPAPAPRGFDTASFFGGIVLVLGLLGIGYFGVRIYRQRVDRSYHTL